MKELDVDAMESFGENTDLAGPVMDNVNRAGERQCVCVCVEVVIAPVTCMRLSEKGELEPLSHIIR